MTPTRRAFIRDVGIAIAALAMARCVPFKEGVPGKSGGTPRDRLHECWTGFGWLAERTRDWDNDEAGEEALNQLIANHQAALAELVAQGELTQTVADEVQAAFDAAAYHVWRSNAPITCYEPMYPDYTPTGAAQLVAQAGALAEIAAQSDADPDTVARVQATIARDVAFLSLTYPEVQALYEGLHDAAAAGAPYPTFDELELPVTPDEAEAARFLVELLLSDD
ncbi:MAG: hypothetical protein JXD18_05255 [Anaerolineae bacterium]|nr:hypothetical protein [Anaerolineae bacterium]